ncbi:MAG: polysaccharide biosynthesis tyrosine autokinase [FCB group bacterium]|nr:polysaccharide biosynthesis tyrosine autokinase [FCB group bacterium]
MEIKKLWDIILRRKWIIIQAFVIIFAVILIGTLLQTPTYFALCHVVIEQQGTQEALLRSIGLEQVSEMLFSMNLGQKSSMVNIEMMKIMTKPILDKVAERMDLRNDKGEIVPGPSLNITNPTFFWFPLRGILVKPHKQSNVMQISGYSADPQEAILFCNTLTQVYFDSDIEGKHKETQEAAHFAEEQSIRAKADWNEAKRKFKEFQESENLVDFSTEANIIINQIAQLRADQNLLELALGEAGGIDTGILDPYMIGGQSLSNAGQISQLKGNLAQLESELNSSLTKYTANHPEVIGVKEQIRDLEEKLFQEKQIFEESGTERFNTIEEQIKGLNAQLSSFPAKLYTMAQLSLSADTYQKMYEMLLDMKYRLNITEAMQISKLSVIEPAWKAKIYSPDMLTNLLVAVALGLIMGFGLAFLIEYLDDTFKNGEDVQLQLDIPLLGNVPMISKKENRYLDTVGDDANRRQIHLLNEAFNIINYNIKLGSLDSEVKHVMVTSSTPGEGKTSISSNLGINLARKGKKVVIVDSDFPRPNIYKIFGVSNEKGLTNVLLGENSIEEVIQKTATENLYLITTGPKPPSSTILIESHQMREFIKDLEEKFDFIIFDTPPVLTLNDPVILGSYVDKTIMVIGANEVSRGLAKQGLITLSKSRNNVLGAVLNKVRSEGSHYYYYYYYHTEDSGNGFKKLWYNSLSIMGIKKKRKRRTQRKLPLDN